MELSVKNTQGEIVDTIKVNDSLFDVPMNQAVVHQVMVAQLANARVGTASTKTRRDVVGGGRKPRPQKGSGRSRQGTIRAPQWKGGGVVFGPHPRSYRQRTPRKMKRLAIKVLLSDKAREDRIIVLQDILLEQPSTKQMSEILDNLGVESASLIVTREPNHNLVKSVANLKRVQVVPAHTLNAIALLNCRTLLLTVDAVRKAEEVWGSPFVRIKKKISAAV